MFGKCTPSNTCVKVVYEKGVVYSDVAYVCVNTHLHTTYKYTKKIFGRLLSMR